MKMMRLPYSWSRLSESSGYQVFKLMQFGSTLLISIVLAKWVGKGEALFAWESVMLVSGSVCAILNYGLGNFFLQCWQPTTSLREFWGFSTMLGLIGALLTILLMQFMSLGSFIYSGLAALFAFSTVSGLILEFWLLKRRRGKSLVVVGIIYFGILMITVSVPIILGYHIKHALFAIGIIPLFRYLWFTSLALTETLLPGLKLHSHLFWPLLGVALITTSNSFIAGYVVRWLDTAESFQLYRYAARELPLTLILASALSVAFAAAVSNNGSLSTDISAQFKLRTRKLMRLVFPLTWVLILTSPFLFRYAYNPEFVPAAKVFNLFLLLVIPRVVFPQSILVGLQQNKAVLRVAAIEWIVHSLLVVVGVYYMGFEGAAIAMLIAYSVDKLLLIHKVSRLGIPASQYIPMGAWLLYSLVTIAVYVTMRMVNL